jgi:hypothetical protein
MKNLYYLILILFFACSKDDSEITTIPEPIQTNTFGLSVNGAKIAETITEINAYYLCDEQIWINVFSVKNNVKSELFSMYLDKKGNLEFAKFVDKSDSFSQSYQTADFIPASTLNIDEFQFTENKLLKIKFSGNLLKQVYNFNNLSESKKINGTIEVNKFGKSECNVFNDFINLNNEIKFTDISRTQQDTKPELTVTYEANSIHGYAIQFKNFTKFIPDMPLGTYYFNDLSKSEKIEFRKYIGIPKVFYSSIYLPNDWKFYDTAGSFTIVEKKQINGKLVVKLNLNFTAKYKGVIEYSFSNAEYETVM